jgi:hypothetical protein
VKFGHSPADRLGKWLRHLVEAFRICDIDAGVFDRDRRRCNRT